MNVLDSKEALEELIHENEIVLVYFGGNACNVCNDLKPKVKEILERYPKAKSAYIDVGKSKNIGISYGFFTIPAILLFVEGKETIREARHISIQDIEAKISRYYDMIFN